MRREGESEINGRKEGIKKMSPWKLTPKFFYSLINESIKTKCGKKVEKKKKEKEKSIKISKNVAEITSLKRREDGNECGFCGKARRHSMSQGSHGLKSMKDEWPCKSIHRMDKWNPA